MDISEIISYDKQFPLELQAKGQDGLMKSTGIVVYLVHAECDEAIKALDDAQAEGLSPSMAGRKALAACIRNWDLGKYSIDGVSEYSPEAAHTFVERMKWAIPQMTEVVRDYANFSSL